MAKETVDLGKFQKGINSVAPDTDLPEGSLTSALNVDLDKEGNVYRRKGYTQIYSGSGIHSLYAKYFVEGSELKDLDGTIIQTGLSLSKFLAWETVLGEHYYSDGSILRTVEHGSAGVPTPPGNPTLSETTGLLDGGLYQVTIAYRSPNTGEIGGVRLASVITVGDNSGILLNDIPVSPDGYDVVIYVSTQNGEELYQNGVVSNGLTAYTIVNSRKSTRILNTQFMEPLPGGHIIRHFKARLYVARDNVLWFSEAFRYGLRKTNKDFFQFASKITIVQPVTDGVYVVADKTYFLEGTEPSKMALTVVSDDKGIEGTGITMGGQPFGIEADVEVGYWFSKKGAILGLPAGELKFLTEDRLALETDLVSGSTMFKEVSGIKQMVTNFSNKGDVSEFKFADQITSQIIRNGVIVN